MNNELEKQIIIDDLIKQLNEKTIVIMLLRERLDRKEQECERLTRDYFKQNEWLKEQKKELDQFKEENDELKRTIMYKCPQCGDEYLSPIGASLYEENNKLKQTLAEIKEIAKWHTTSADSEDIQEDMKQILQKIS